VIYLLINVLLELRKSAFLLQFLETEIFSSKQ